MTPQTHFHMAGSASEPRLLAGLDVLDLEVTPIGDDIDALDVEDDAGRFGCLHQQGDVHDLVGHGLLDDHFVLRVVFAKANGYTSSCAKFCNKRDSTATG